jgi:UPF0271 protein
MTVDLNIDLGELPVEPQELYALSTVVNLACGGHAGDVASMKRGVELALHYGPRIAAHPSYPDRDQFGRARMAIPLDFLYESIVEQVTTLSMITTEMGGTLWGAKLHGALYHAASEDPQLAAAVLDAIVAACPNGLVITGPPWGHLEDASRARELRYLREGFADRAYDASGQLVARGTPGDILDDPQVCADQAVRLAQSGQLETLCVHSDTPSAVAIARAVRGALDHHALLRFEPDPSDDVPPAS